MSWQSSRPSLFSSVGLLVVLAFLADCRRPSVADSRRGEREHSAAPVLPSSGSRVDSADVVPPAPARAEGSAGWAESTMYSFRVGEIRRCGPGTPLHLGKVARAFLREAGPWPTPVASVVQKTQPVRPDRQLGGGEPGNRLGSHVGRIRLDEIGAPALPVWLVPPEDARAPPTVPRGHTGPGSEAVRRLRVQVDGFGQQH